MDEKTLARVRRVNLHARVGIGNDTPAWLGGRTIYGATLDGKYHGQPRCRTFEGALRKAEALIKQIDAALAMQGPAQPDPNEAAIRAAHGLENAFLSEEDCERLGIEF